MSDAYIADCVTQIGEVRILSFLICFYFLFIFHKLQIM